MSRQRQQSYLPWMSPQQAPATTALESVLGSRRCRKTLQSGEDVWPVHLEAALLEGLQNYIPDDSRETRILGRFRGRNQFISEYIFAKTGERRSNKQVGSRLQQLRHCSNDPTIRRLLTPFRPPTSHNREHFGRRDSMSSDDLHSEPELPQKVPICIPILSRNPSYTTPGHPSAQPTRGLQIANGPRHLESITPTVTFLSPNPIVAQSFFAVWYGSQVVHTETVPLMVLMDEPPHGVTGFLHSTELVPAYWNKIVDSPDPSRFVISQEVVKDREDAIAFSAEYRFVY